VGMAGVPCMAVPGGGHFCRLRVKQGGAMSRMTVLVRLHGRRVSRGSTGAHIFRVSFVVTEDDWVPGRVPRPQP